MNELLFLVADHNMADAVRGLLSRDKVHQAIGCRKFDFDERRDVKVAVGQNDPGLYVRANELLRPLAADYRHAVVIMDEDWDGSPGADTIQARLAVHLADAGWAERDGVGLVVRPEADVWLWSDSPHSAKALGWDSWDELRPALERQGWLKSQQVKPTQPKEAAEWALRQKKTRRSSATYRKVAASVSLKRCQDSALEQLLNSLRTWFPLEDN